MVQGIVQSGLLLLCTELTLFCIELPENCIYLHQSELRNFFIYLITIVMIKDTLDNKPHRFLGMLDILSL